MASFNSTILYAILYPIFNSPVLNNPIGGIATVLALAEVAFGLVFLTLRLAASYTFRIKRETYNLNTTDENFLHYLLLRVLTALDDSECIALALCYASSFMPEHRTTHNITLSPQPDLPIPWDEHHTPASKYQYASFIGRWAKFTSNQTQCSQVFPSCPFLPADVVKLLANRKVW
ncbi:uncharacterized protein [Cherax quadricarinatus]|uniref:uncharacterized protein n=1 Tax=Cherax quadricarinatus TaxID=27406 RepID=UPI00387EBDBF